MSIKIKNLYLTIVNDDKKVTELLSQILKNQSTIMANDAQALADLDAIKTTLTKISTESSASLQKITELEQLAQENNVSQAVLDKIAEVKALAQGIDDLVPDNPVANENNGNPA